MKPQRPGIRHQQSLRSSRSRAHEMPGATKGKASGKGTFSNPKVKVREKGKRKPNGTDSRLQKRHGKVIGKTTNDGSQFCHRFHLYNTCTSPQRKVSHTCPVRWMASYAVRSIVLMMMGKWRTDLEKIRTILMRRKLLYETLAFWQTGQFNENPQSLMQALDGLPTTDSDQPEIQCSLRPLTQEDSVSQLDEEHIRNTYSLTQKSVQQQLTNKPLQKQQIWTLHPSIVLDQSNITRFTQTMWINWCTFHSGWNYLTLYAFFFGTTGKRQPLSTLVASLGIETLRPFDILLNSKLDILDDEFYFTILRRVASRQIGTIIATPPCTEYSLLKLKQPGPKPCRLPDKLEEPLFDTPDCHPRFFSSREEILRRTSTIIVHVNHSHGGYSGLEQPLHAMSWNESNTRGSGRFPYRICSFWSLPGCWTNHMRKHWTNIGFLYPTFRASTMPTFNVPGTPNMRIAQVAEKLMEAIFPKLWQNTRKNWSSTSFSFWSCNLQNSRSGHQSFPLHHRDLQLGLNIFQMAQVWSLQPYGPYLSNQIFS